jgi:hypothetical protein
VRNATFVYGSGLEALSMKFDGKRTIRQLGAACGPVWGEASFLI